MTEFQRMAAITVLKQMFAGGHFSICTVDKVIQITGCIPPDPKDYQALSALHCVDWADMSQDLRNQVMLKTLQIFEQPGFDLELIDKVINNANSALRLSH